MIIFTNFLFLAIQCFGSFVKQRAGYSNAKLVEEVCMPRKFGCFSDIDKFEAAEAAKNAKDFFALVVSLDISGVELIGIIENRLNKARAQMDGKFAKELQEIVSSANLQLTSPYLWMQWYKELNRDIFP